MYKIIHKTSHSAHTLIYHCFSLSIVSSCRVIASQLSKLPVVYICTCMQLNVAVAYWRVMYNPSPPTNIEWLLIQQCDVC